MKRAVAMESLRFNWTISTEQIQNKFMEIWYCMGDKYRWAFVMELRCLVTTRARDWVHWWAQCSELGRGKWLVSGMARRTDIGIVIEKEWHLGLERGLSMVG